MCAPAQSQTLKRRMRGGRTRRVGHTPRACMGRASARFTLGARGELRCARGDCQTTGRPRGSAATLCLSLTAPRFGARQIDSEDGDGVGGAGGAGGTHGSGGNPGGRRSFGKAGPARSDAHAPAATAERQGGDRAGAAAG
eukprot:6165517-Prymnesium_polylepis.1